MASDPPSLPRRSPRSPIPFTLSPNVGPGASPATSSILRRRSPRISAPQASNGSPVANGGTPRSLPAPGFPFSGKALFSGGPTSGDMKISVSTGLNNGDVKLFFSGQAVIPADVLRQVISDGGGVVELPFSGEVVFAGEGSGVESNGGFKVPGAKRVETGRGVGRPPKKQRMSPRVNYDPTKLEDINGSTYFVEDPVPEEEARRRWPHHYENQRPRGSRAVYPLALILSTTRELSVQIHEAKKFAYQSGVRAVVVCGGAPVNQQMRELDRDVDILVATPGRLVDLLERAKVSLQQIRLKICLNVQAAFI